MIIINKSHATTKYPLWHNQYDKSNIKSMARRRTNIDIYITQILESLCSLLIAHIIIPITTIVYNIVIKRGKYWTIKHTDSFIVKLY